MPANVTHMLIAHKALQTLKAKGIDEFAEFAEVLDDSSKSRNYKAYVNLGSLGPDLYYYAKMPSSIKDMLKQGKDFTNKHKQRFLRIVSDADLSCPLKQEIPKKAYAALRNERNMTVAVKEHMPDLLKKTRVLTSNRIFKIKSDRDMVKALQGQL